MKSKLVYTGRLTIIVLVLVLVVLGYVYYEKTLITWWEPVAVSFVAALLTAPLLFKYWKWLTGTDHRIVNMLCHAYVTGCLIYFFILGGNYLLADEESVVAEKVLVLDKKAETRELRQRVARHRYRTKTVRYYYLNVQFDDGTCKKVPVSLTVYNRSRIGGYRTFKLQRGGWGFRVIK